MAKKKTVWIIVVLCLMVLIMGGTIYVNKVVLPVQIKSMAILQAKNILKRNVEIGSLHFSWVKGLILEDIKVYQKDSPDIFFHSKRVSVGIIFIPGFKEHHLTIPFVDILDPDVHLIRKDTQEWNFSDLLSSSSTNNNADKNKASNIKINILGFNIINGHVSIDDKTSTVPFHQDLENVNVKIGLSVNGIAFDTAAILNQTNSAINIKGAYQPISKALDAHIYLKNIALSQYLALLPPIPGIIVNDTLLKEINVDAHYDESLYSLKGNINTADINVKYGTMALSGNVEANIDQCEIRKGSINFDASVTARNASLILTPTQTFKGTLSLEKARIRQDKDGTQFVGTISAEHLDAAYDGKTLRGDILARPITLEMKNDNDIDLKGDIKSNHLDITLDDQHSFAGKLNINAAHVHLINKKDLTFDGKIALDELDIIPLPHVHVAGSVDLKNISLALKDDILKVKTNGELNNWQVNLGQDKSIVAEASFGVEATYPLKKPESLSYTGTFTVDQADVIGYPYGPFKAITAKGDFKTDQISFKLFSFVALDSAFKGAATVMNFKDPVISVEVANESIDLSKIKDIIPEIYAQYGLDTKGKASFNASFEGLASSPLSGKINVKAQLQNVDVSSAKFNQHASNINGNLEGTPDSLSWSDFSGTYLDKKYTLTGTLNDLKAPKIRTTLNGDDIKLDIAIENKGNAWNISKLIGKYFDIIFDAKGSITLPAGQPPLVDIQTSLKMKIEKALTLLPEAQRKGIEPLGLKGDVSIDAYVGGNINDWKNLTSNATIKSPAITVMGYHLDDVIITLNQHDGKLSNATVDATAYTGKIHNVVNLDLLDAAMPFDIALNVDALDLRLLKTDVPSLKGKEIKGKFYLTTVNKGKIADIKNLSGKGSLAIREGFLTEFKFFKGLLGILNEVMRLGQLTITDVEGNFTIENQKITTDNLHLISPTINLLTEGWVNLDQKCDLHVSVDMTTGVIPPVAEEVLRSLKIHIYDKITAPKFDKKISVPQVINSVLRTIGIFQ